MKRRTLLGIFASTAVVWPHAAWAQRSALPVVGFLSALSITETSDILMAFRTGMNEAGMLESKNFSLDLRFADGQYARLPALASELIHRPADLIIAAAPPAALAAKGATTTIPIIFVVGFDPVAHGLVASLNRPGGNATGMTLFSTSLVQKRLGILLELAPHATMVAILANSTSANSKPEIEAIQAVVQQRGLQFQAIDASSQSDLGVAFARLSQLQPQALIVGSDPFYVMQRQGLIAQFARLAIPTIYPFREFAASGGLISYGTNIAHAYRQAGTYAARVLRGEKPADLPVQQPNKFELVINLMTAKELGLSVPPTLVALADEVIE